MPRMPFLPATHIHLGFRTVLSGSVGTRRQASSKFFPSEGGGEYLLIARKWSNSRPNARGSSGVGALIPPSFRLPPCPSGGYVQISRMRPLRNQWTRVSARWTAASACPGDTERGTDSSSVPCRSSCVVHSSLIMSATTDTEPRSETHFDGLSRIALIILPSVVIGSLGVTTGLAAASTARTASRYAPLGSALRPYTRCHARWRCRAAFPFSAISSLAACSTVSSTRRCRQGRPAASSPTVQADPLTASMTVSASRNSQALGLRAATVRQ
jgi:hypothetical protein